MIDAETRNLVIKIYLVDFKVGQDPHYELAMALNTTREDAKVIAYKTIYSMPFIRFLLPSNHKGKKCQS